MARNLFLANWLVGWIGSGLDGKAAPSYRIEVCICLVQKVYIEIKYSVHSGNRCQQVLLVKNAYILIRPVCFRRYDCILLHRLLLLLYFSHARRVFVLWFVRTPHKSREVRIKFVRAVDLRQIVHCIRYMAMQKCDLIPKKFAAEQHTPMPVEWLCGK